VAPQPARARPESQAASHVISHIPEELTQGTLRRLGEASGSGLRVRALGGVPERTPLEMSR